MLYADDVNAVVFLPNGGNFCSGGDVHDIIGPLVAMDAEGVARLHAHDRRSGQGDAPLRQADHRRGRRRRAGAGAIIAMASDMRIATPAAQTAFLFNRVGLAGCDMGACAILPRIIGQGRAAELLYTGRAMTAQEGEHWGFFNRLVAADALEQEALTLARRIAAGPTFANGITKTQLNAGMVDEPRSGDRGRGAGAGDLHADQRFRARLSGVRRQAETGVRGQLVADKSFPHLAVLRPTAIARWRQAIERWCAANLPVDHGDVDAACRDLVQKLGRDGWLDAYRARSRRARHRSTCARSA